MHALSLSRLTDDDIPGLAELSASVGWGDTEEAWAAILRCGVAFGHRSADGSVVSSGALFDFGAVASVGKMIVRPDARGRGLARAALSACLEARPSPGAHTTLSATPLGEPLYRKAGFRPIGRVCKLRSPGEPAREAPCVSMGYHLDELARLDRAAFGGDRRRLLEARLGQPGARAAVLEGPSGALGYALSVPARGATVVGPVVAPELQGALSLLEALGGGQGPLVIDVPEGQGGLVRALEQRGFEPLSHHAVMSMGGTEPPGERERLFAMAAQAFG